jgi:hypothetical protein
MNALIRRLIVCAATAAACLIVLAPSIATAASAPHLDYYGGRVLTHVKVDVVVWDRWSYGSSAHLTGNRSVESYFKAVTASPYLDWLDEYDTPTQHIGRGTLEGVYTVHPPPADNGSTITNTEIEDGLRALIKAKQLPNPSTTRVFAIFFPSHTTISTPDGDSVHDFCAYHDTMAWTSRSTAYYAVMPYEVGNRGCKAAPSTFDSLTTVTSHELVEAITDPGIGLGRLTWYDSDNGEVADICAGGSSSVAHIKGADGVTYAVQRAWSNRVGACIAAP